MGKSNPVPAFLRIAGRQTDGDSPGRQREPGVGERRGHALATLLHLAGRKADQCPVGQTRGDVDLDAHIIGVDPEHGGRADGGEHDVDPTRARARVVIVLLRPE